MKEENIREVEDITIEPTTEALDDECSVEHTTDTDVPGDEPCDSEPAFNKDFDDDEYYDEDDCRCVNSCCKDKTITVTMTTAAVAIGAAVLAGIYIGKLIFKKD